MKPSNNIYRVKSLLKYVPESRDDDNVLVSAMWATDLQELGFVEHMMSGTGLLSLLRKGKLTNTESIRRCRQQLQKEFPELRGEKYNARHKHTEDVLKDLFENPAFYEGHGGTP